MTLFDMVGNVIEFVADWGPLATTGATWGVVIQGLNDGLCQLGRARPASCRPPMSKVGEVLVAGYR